MNKKTFDLKRTCVLVCMLICLFTCIFYCCIAAFADPAAGSQEFTRSDVFFAYPRVLRESEPIITRLYTDSENAIRTMESDNGDLLALIQTVLDDPEDGAVTTLQNLISGTDGRGEDCSFKATEELLSQLGASGELYEFGQFCTGPYQEFYKKAKIAKDVNEGVESIAKLYLETQNDKVIKVLTALLSDESGVVRDLILEDNTSYRNDLLDAIDKGTEGLSDAMDLLKYANRLTEMVETIVLLENVNGELLDYLYSVITTEDLHSAIETYRSYRANYYVGYIKDKWVKEDVLDKAVHVFKDTITAVSGGQYAHVGPAAFYEISKLTLKYIGKALGNASGYGDADDLITAYKSWNYVQDLERNLRNQRNLIINNPCTMEYISNYERAYELYVCAVVSFAKSAKKANTNAGGIIDTDLAAVENMRENYAQNGNGPFYMHIDHCRDLLASDENRDSWYRQAPDNEELKYIFSEKGTVIISAPSNTLTENTIYTAPDGNFFYGIELTRTVLEVTCDASTPGNVICTTWEYVLKVCDGASLHIGGDFKAPYSESSYSYRNSRSVEINGSLTVDGDLYLTNGKVTVSGDTAKLQVNGDTDITWYEENDIRSGELIFNGQMTSNIEDIGQAVVRLNTPAGKIAVLKTVKLGTLDDSSMEAVPDTAASVVLRETAAEQGQEAEYEISGNAPGHELIVYDKLRQTGESTFGSMQLSSINGRCGMTIAGNTEIPGNTTSDLQEYGLTIAEGAGLHIGGDFKAPYNEFANPDRNRRSVEINGSLTVDGDMSLVYGKVIVSGDTAKLQVNGDTDITWYEENDIRSGELIFNGALTSNIKDIGSAQISVTGHNTGKVSFMGISLERNENSPNLKATGSEDAVLIGAYDENVPLSASSLTLSDYTFEFTDGTYDIAEVTLLSGRLGLSNSLVFNGDLLLKGGNTEQSDENSDVTLYGDLHITNSEGIFSGGTLNVAGNLLEYWNGDYVETGSHKTVLNGTAAQTIAMYSHDKHISTLVLENTSEEGVMFDSEIYVDTLFDHQRNNFLLYSDDETQFADYDNDGVKDHKDPYPKDPEKSYLDFTVLPIADQKYTGEELKPELVVTDEEGTQLKPESDYETVFTDNIRPGTATAVVTGKRFHTASKEVTFNIICDHTWGKWGLVETPTAEQTGSRQRTCSLCGETETQDIPALEAVLNLPAGLTRIESEAFSGLASADAVRIPETVTEIAEDAFTGSDIIIIAPEGSYAVEWAEYHNVIYIIE